MSRRTRISHVDGGAYWVSGEVGQGKTTLLRDLSKRLRHEGFSCALVPVANLDAKSLVIWCLHQLSLPRDGGMDTLTRVAESGLFVLVDDAEHLPIDSSLLLSELASHERTRVLYTGTGKMPTRLAPAKQLTLGTDRNESLERMYSILQPQVSSPRFPAAEPIPSSRTGRSPESEASRVATEGSTYEALALEEDRESVPMPAISPQPQTESVPAWTPSPTIAGSRVDRLWVFSGLAATVGLYLIFGLLNPIETPAPAEQSKSLVPMQTGESPVPRVSMAPVENPIEISESTDHSVDGESARSNTVQPIVQSVASRAERGPSPMPDSGQLPADTTALSMRPDATEPVARASPVLPVSPQSTESQMPPIEYTRVIVNAVPSARVWMDGEAVGGTPIAELKVPRGVHRFRADFPDGSDVARDVEVTGEFVVLVFP